MPLNSKILFILLFLAFTAYAQQERLAIIQTLDNNDSIGFNDLAYLTDKLRETAVNILPKEQYGVMTTESIVAFLGSQERAAKICNESSCLAELGRMVSADYVAQGRIGRFGRDLTIKVELYNVKTGNLIGSFTGDSKDIYGLRDIITEKATDLFKKMPNTSKVQKTVPPPKAPTPPPQQETQQVQSTNKDDENRMKGAFGYALLNTIPGFGLGSYIQGDKTSGMILSIADGFSLVLLLSAGIVSPGVCYDKPEPNEISCDSFEWKYAEVALATGIVVLGASRIAGWIFAYNYANKYNKLLNETLNSNNNVSFSIDPLIVPKDGTPAVGLAFNLRY